MKVVFIGIVIFTMVLAALGQGTFSSPTNLTAYLDGACEVPANESTIEANAVLSYNLLSYNPLSNTIVSCDVYLPISFSPTSAGIYGPADPTQTGPLLFDLGQCQTITNIWVIMSWPPVANPPTITNIFKAYTNMITITPQ